MIAAGALYSGKKKSKEVLCLQTDHSSLIWIFAYHQSSPGWQTVDCDVYLKIFTLTPGDGFEEGETIFIRYISSSPINFVIFILPECHRWVSCRTGGALSHIQDKLFRKAKRVRVARWQKGESPWIGFLPKED